MTDSPQFDAAAHSTKLASEKVRESLVRGRCTACEGAMEVLQVETVRAQMAGLDGWTLDEEAGAISRKINGKSFVRVMEMVNRIAVLAEEQQHHPDLHVTGYRHLQIVLTTHAIGGLSVNDLIVAAKIDELLR